MSSGQQTYRPSILPVLVYRDGRAAIDWCVRVFGLEELRRVEDDKGEILHAELRWEHGGVMLTSLAADGDGALAAMLGSSWVWAVVADADAHHRRAAAAGARILIEPRSVAHGSRSYRALDLEGHRWTFSTHGPAPSA
jgi:uncharacterized glyoxalase superfamily protein PhnB